MLFVFLLVRKRLRFFVASEKKPRKHGLISCKKSDPMNTGHFPWHAQTYPLYRDTNVTVWKHYKFTNTSTSVLYFRNIPVFQKWSKFPHFQIFSENFLIGEMYLGVSFIPRHNVIGT